MSPFKVSVKPGLAHNIKVTSGRDGLVATDAANIILSQQGDEHAMDFDALARELSLLRDAMKSESRGPEDDEAVGEVAAAELAAKEKNETKVVEKLSAAGKWAFDVATKIGTAIAADAIKKSLGL